MIIEKDCSSFWSPKLTKNWVSCLYKTNAQSLKPKYDAKIYTAHECFILTIVF